MKIKIWGSLNKRQSDLSCRNVFAAKWCMQFVWDCTFVCLHQTICEMDSLWLIYHFIYHKQSKKNFQTGSIFYKSGEVRQTGLCNLNISSSYTGQKLIWQPFLQMIFEYIPAWLDHQRRVYFSSPNQEWFQKHVQCPLQQANTKSDGWMKRWTEK